MIKHLATFEIPKWAWWKISDRQRILIQTFSASFSFPGCCRFKQACSNVWSICNCCASSISEITLWIVFDTINPPSARTFHSTYWCCFFPKSGSLWQDCTQAVNSVVKVFRPKLPELVILLWFLVLSPTLQQLSLDNGPLAFFRETEYSSHQMCTLQRTSLLCNIFWGLYCTFSQVQAFDAIQ